MAHSCKEGLLASLSYSNGESLKVASMLAGIIP